MTIDTTGRADSETSTSVSSAECVDVIHVVKTRKMKTVVGFIVIVPDKARAWAKAVERAMEAEPEPIKYWTNPDFQGYKMAAKSLNKAIKRHLKGKK